MRLKWSVGALTACVVAGAGFLAYHHYWNSPATRANHLLSLLEQRNWRELYRARSAGRFAGAWTEETFVAFAKKYIEPKGGNAKLRAETGGINQLKNYQIYLSGPRLSDPPAFSAFYMALPQMNQYHVLGSSEVASGWDYVFTLGCSETLSVAAKAWYPNAPKTKNNIDDPALYEFILAEGDNLRKMGCAKLYSSSKKDDLAYKVESIEQHARLYKTARNLVPVAAKYGRKMKYPPTAAELAMK